MKVPLSEVRTHGTVNNGVYTLITSYTTLDGDDDHVLHFSKYRQHMFRINGEIQFNQFYAEDGSLICQDYMVRTNNKTLHYILIKNK